MTLGSSSNRGREFMTTVRHQSPSCSQPATQWWSKCSRMPSNCTWADWYPPTKDICSRESPLMWRTCSALHEPVQLWNVSIKISSIYSQTQNWLRPSVITSWRGRCFSPLLKRQQKLLVCFIAAIFIQALLKPYSHVSVSLAELHVCSLVVANSQML